MESNERIELEQKIRGELWEERLNESYKCSDLCAWVSITSASLVSLQGRNPIMANRMLA
jgi:hypothetical protein